MTVRVDTKLPFEGIVHTIGHKYVSNNAMRPKLLYFIIRSEGGCYEVGRGGLKTFLYLDISTAGRCGVQFNTVSIMPLNWITSDGPNILGDW